ncbi:hypothetical protein RRG08_013276 [Elysia crispata]|uniref:Uncharacterized protein n=1 Tax=Elysia crispata TaxID=231223 RepID=A0AAE1BAF2_9GAST|nr:hypothetical protein RRG08_013276 [Elysia crispata]
MTALVYWSAYWSEQFLGIRGNKESDRLSRSASTASWYGSLHRHIGVSRSIVSSNHLCTGLFAHSFGYPNVNERTFLIFTVSFLCLLLLALFDPTWGYETSSVDLALSRGADDAEVEETQLGGRTDQ